jgi:hypothetical protein
LGFAISAVFGGYRRPALVMHHGHLPAFASVTGRLGMRLALVLAVSLAVTVIFCERRRANEKGGRHCQCCEESRFHIPGSVLARLPVVSSTVQQGKKP